MKLLIVESPSKAKTINQYLGKEYEVISSYGHIRALPSETGSVVPEEDFKMIYKVIDKSEKRVDEIVKKVKKCDEIYLATDPDREGEAISWHLIEALKEKKALPKDMPYKRVVFYEITKKAILAAMQTPRDINLDLVHAQQARQGLDYLVGFSISPVLWRKLPGSKSAGRVQSVALKIICEREDEIEKFKIEEYWTIHGMFAHQKDSFKTFLTHFDGKKLEKFFIPNEATANDLLKKLKGLSYSVKDTEEKKQNRFPAPPFTTSSMLQEASRKLGYTAKKTSKIAQDLYEGMEIDGQTSGLITYMRTDSVSVSADAIAATRNLIGSSFGDKYLPEKPKFYKTKTKNAQEAHEAIRPTNVANTPDKVRKALSDDHFKLYDLIWKRMVASQMENAVMNIVTVNVTSDDGKANFRASGSTIEFDGFLKLYMETHDDEEDEDKQRLPKLNSGLPLALNAIDPVQHFTQPPPRYTEASLVKRMEELGIGRPSTYPAIISILQTREYVVVDKKRFMPETKGRLVSSFLDHYFGEYFQYNFTANLEDKLDHVSNGEDDWKKVLKEFWAPFKVNVDGVMKIKNQDILESIQAHLEKFVFDSLAKDGKGNHPCPSCKTGVLGLKAGKFGAFVGCSNYPECKFVHKTGVMSDGDEAAADTQQSEFPIILGKLDGAEVVIRKGPYGIYIQKTAGKDIKRVGLPKGNDYKKIDMEYAKSLLSLPRIVGAHPEGGDVKAGLGRFGPYVEYNKKFHSIKNFDPATISMEDAMKAINTPKAPRKGKK